MMCLVRLNHHGCQTHLCYIMDAAQDNLDQNHITSSGIAQHHTKKGTPISELDPDPGEPFAGDADGGCGSVRARAGAGSWELGARSDARDALDGTRHGCGCQNRSGIPFR